jgi:malate dehydrogenase
MGHSVKRIVVTGAGGQIAYSLIFRIANGELLGPNQRIALHLLDLPEGVESLKGLVMELEDCTFPLVKEIHIGSNPAKIFEGADYALLVGSKPRGPGMERKDLLADNGKIFVEQGKALNQSASKDVRVLVVGNPCNTNCLIAMSHAPKIDPRQFFSMTRLDQNRAVYQLAHRAGCSIEEVSNVTVWGNHSSTQVPDFENGKIRGKPVSQIITDRKWLEEEFVPLIQKRGAQVIAARGKSSAASAANAALGAMRSMIEPTHQNEWFSMGVCAKNNPYGIDEGLVFSFPCRSNGKGDFEIVPGLHISSYLEKKIALTQKELMEERAMVAHLLGSAL